MAPKRKRKSKSRAAAPAQTPLEPVEISYAESQAGMTRREKRLARVVSMMCRGQWLSGVTDELLAQEWKCDPSNVRHIAAEANRVIRTRLREDPKSQAEARALILQNIEVIRAKAMGNGDAQSLRVGLDALRAYGFYLGIEPAKKLEVARSDPFDGWTTDEKLAYSQSGRKPRRALATVSAQGGGDSGDAGADEMH